MQSCQYLYVVHRLKKQVFRIKIGVDANHEKSSLIVDDDKFWTIIHH